MTYQALNFFKELSLEEIEWLLQNAKPVSVSANATLITEGGHGDHIYFVIDGIFDVLVRDATGREVSAGRRGRGEIIGEISWLDGEQTSATVKAAESGGVLALSTAELDEKIAAVPEFSSHFYKGVARVLSSRLRSAGALIAQGRPGESTAPWTPSATSVGPLQEQLTTFKELIAGADHTARASKESVPEDLKKQIIAQFRLLSSKLTELTFASHLPKSERSAIGRQANREMLPYVMLSSAAERMYSQPRGYAGDYLTIDMIYNNQPSGIGRIGPLIDECFLNEPPARAVRNRRQLLAAQIKHQLHLQSGRARVTSLACGPAREIFDCISEVGRDTLELTGLDIDQEALSFLRRRAQEEHVNLNLHHANLIYLATGRQDLELPQQDFIYSIGLIDYFDDSFVIKLLNWIFDRLRPGGRVILGNFHPRNSMRGLMEHVLDWKLIHRDEVKMNELYSSSKFKKPSTNIMFEPEGINLFAECIKD